MSEKKKSVYATIADDIISKIKGGTYIIGSLLPPEREFMEIYSVQRTTIRRGLEILSREGYIRKVAGLGSVVNSDVPVEISDGQVTVITAAAPIKDEKIKNISVLLPSADTDRHPSVVVDLLAALGKKASCYMSADESEINASAETISFGVTPESLKNVVFAFSQSDDYRSVVLDGDKAAYNALTYLEQLGHTKIGFVGTNSSLPFENALYDSFAAVNSFFDEELVYLSSADEKCGFDGFSELFRRHGAKLTAVCTANDEIAKGVLKAAKYYKLAIPSDLSVISLCSSNNNSKIDAVLYDMDELCDELLYSLKVKNRIASILFSGELSVRGTCAKAENSTASSKNMSDFLL